MKDDNKNINDDKERNLILSFAGCFAFVYCLSLSLDDNGLTSKTGY